MKFELHLKDGSTETIPQVNGSQIVEGQMQVYQWQIRQMVTIPLKDIDWFMVREEDK